MTQAPSLWPAALADERLVPWFEVVLAEVPGGELYDAHTHIGVNDPDGFKLAPEQLLAGLERAHARGVVFPMHEPDGYPPANDAVLELAAASEGRLVAFGRLDPAADPLGEATRALGAGDAVLRAERHPALDRVNDETGHLLTLVLSEKTQHGGRVDRGVLAEPEDVACGAAEHPPIAGHVVAVGARRQGGHWATDALGTLWSHEQTTFDDTRKGREKGSPLFPNGPGERSPYRPGCGFAGTWVCS